MRSLTRAVKRTPRTGEPIPVPFQSWRSDGIDIRRSDLTMIAGQPSSGKSTIALTVAVRAVVPTLYFSADSSLATQATRVLSMTTGTPLATVKQYAQQAGEAFWQEPRVVDALAAVAHIHWNFHGQPTFKDIDEELAAFETREGAPPELIVVDNATDIAFGDGDEYGSLRELMRQLKLTARDTGAAVIALHHMTESIQGDPCPPMRAVHGKVSQVPAVILSIGQARDGFLPICPVKNRDGRSDPSGSTPVWLQYRPDLMSVTDMQEAA